MAQFFLFDHPLIQHKISMLRDKNTSTKEFRELVHEISMLMAYEVTRDLPLTDKEIETPVAKTTAKVLAGKKVALSIIPNAKVGHIGLYRDPNTLKPVEYYCKLPEDITDREVIVLDPMLATGGSSSAAIQFLKDRGIKNIKFVCLISAPEGIERLQNDHPDVPVFCAAKDERLNDHAYIIPGLGDAGDRLFGTN